MEFRSLGNCVFYRDVVLLVEEIIVPVDPDAQETKWDDNSPRDPFIEGFGLYLLPSDVPVPSI